MSVRAVSTVLDYSMTLAIAAVLMSGLLLAGGEFVERNQEQVIRTELQVIGQQIASDIQTADRLVQANQDAEHMEELTINTSVPDTVAGVGYSTEVYVRTGGDVELRLRTPTSSVNVTVDVQTKTDVAETTLVSGDYAITYDESNEELVLSND